MTDDDLGQLDTSGDSPTLSFVRHYPHPPEKVWRAVTEPDHQRSWFPQQIVGERRAGAPLRFVTPGAAEEFDGEMLAYEPPRLMELRWGTNRLRIELQPEGEGTRLVLTDHLEDPGTGARDGAGWHLCLDFLGAMVEGAEPPPLDDWKTIHSRYVAAFGPEASRIGPPGQ